MNAINFLGLLTIVSCMLPQIATAQDSRQKDSTGLPGDHFSLEGALELFKKSSNLEEFEKSLNQKSNNVNNLDLNNDNKVDYVKVTDKVSKDVHAIILRVNVNAKESQDVAVIAVEKTGETTAVAQIIGDKELYGEEKVVEPVGQDEKRSGSKGSGPMMPETKAVFYVVNVWGWPCVQYIYAPYYSPWSSPWYWGYYPSWWYAWEPYPWYYHHHHCAHYGYYNHVVYVYRVNHAPVYNPHRQASPMVQNHYREARQSFQSGTVNRSGNKVEREPELNRTEPVSRPVEGTQGIRNQRQNNETPSRQTPNVRPTERPMERPVERQNTEPIRQRNPEISRPERTPQVNPQQRTPEISRPQRTPQVSPQRSNPQIRQQPTIPRTAPSRGGMRR